jgi:hypothetical protein
LENTSGHKLEIFDLDGGANIAKKKKVVGEDAQEATPRALFNTLDAAGWIAITTWQDMPMALQSMT